ncbi:MAG: flavodoxin family protein [Anaerolineaceae bacterium]|nr:MAG: flavodoxin family protein [Anaerolineaceae bacterium]
MKIVAISGSPRPKGNTYHALNTVCEELEQEGIATKILQVGNMEIKGCIACNRCKDGYCVYNDDILNNIVDEIYEADGVIIGSPVYYSGISGTLKSFLDRLFYPSQGRMRHKIASGIAVPRRSGGIPAFDQLNHYFLISEMIVVSSYYWNVIHGGSPKEVLEDAEGISVLRNLARNISWMIKMKEETKDSLPAPSAYLRSWTNFIR